MPNMKGLPLNKLILLIALALAVRAILNYNPPVKSLSVGDAPPSFTVSINNAPAGLEVFKGSPLVIFFFANWCPCSHESAPYIVTAAAEFEKQGLKVVGVGIQDSDTELQKFVTKHHFPFPVVYDSKGVIAASYGITTPPTSVFVGKDWKIAAVQIGKIKTYESLAERAKGILR